MLLNALVGALFAAIGLALVFPAANELWFYAQSRPATASVETAVVEEELVAMGGGSRGVTRVIQPSVHVVLQSSASEGQACDVTGLYEVFGDTPISTASQAKELLENLSGGQIVVHAIFDAEGRPLSCRLVKPAWSLQYVKAAARSAAVGLFCLAAATLIFGDLLRRRRKSQLG